MKNIFCSQKGFSVLEVILASALFTIFATGAVLLIVQGHNANRLGKEESVALQYASEGIEAVKSIKNQGFSNISGINPTPRGITRNATNNVWEFKAEGTNNTLFHNTSDNYVRTIKVESVNRNNTPPLGDIVSSGGTDDPDTKKITSNVTWNFNSARPESIKLTTYLSDWIKPIVSGGPIMMAYSKTTSTPYYRIWDGSGWSAEAAAQNVGGNINYIVLKSSRTRNEAVLSTLDSNGNIYAQVWNGSSWSTPTQMANVGSTLAAYRSFDLEYEKNSDRAVIVYLPNSTSADPAYRIWQDNNWTTPTTITAPPTTGVVRWIELAQNPTSTSNEIAMVMLDANIDVYGMVWTGSTWNNMGVSTVWDNSASIATRKAIDVAYEQNSGRALFIWGDATATDQYYRIWNGTSLTSPTLLDIPAAGLTNWVKLVARPDSDEIIYGVQGGTPDLNTRKWSSSAWDSATQHPEHDTGTENATSMNFDIVWETHSSNPGKAWILWGDSARVSKRQWSGSAWGSTTTFNGSDDTSFIRLKADPNSGAIFAGIYEASASTTDDIWESRLTGGGTNWSAKNTIWGGAISAEPVYFRIDIATP